MKTSMGRGGALNNEKNMSQIRCVEDTYMKASPNMVRTRHMKLNPQDTKNTAALVNEIDSDLFEIPLKTEETEKLINERLTIATPQQHLMR